jgi:hypothetical protein
MMVSGLLDGLTDPEVMAEVERREYLVGRLVEQTGVTRNEAVAFRGRDRRQRVRAALMSWLDPLLDRGREAKRDVTDVTPVTHFQPDRGKAAEVQVTWAQTRHADLQSGDPGAVVLVHYTVEGNTGREGTADRPQGHNPQRRNCHPDREAYGIG